MQTIEKNIAVAVLSFMIIALLSGQAVAERKIGILLFSDETRYGEALKGFQDKLRKAVIKEPKVRFIIENAGARKAKAVEITQKFSAKKMDLIFTVGTSATVIAARGINNVPIVFSSVYDPVASGIAKSWKSSGNNTTGNSPLIPMSRIMECLTKFTPVRRLAVFYTPGEKNSESQLKDLQAIQADYKIKVIPVLISKKEEVTQILPEILRTSDALYITGSSVIDSQIAIITDMAANSRVITVTHLKDLVKKGILLGVCADSYLLGRLAGEKALRILNGAKPASLPIEKAENVDIIINMKTAKAGHFPIAPQFNEIVTLRFE
jgi:putative tryptophan/tyrosine transport system substrate-binding protein